MHFSVAVLFAASLASAFTIPKRQTALPACAQTCYDNAPIAPCTADDVACQCLNVNFLTPLVECVTSTCSAEDAQTAQAAALETCKAAGVDLTNPVPACATTCDQDIKSTTCADPSDGACLCNDTTFIQDIHSCLKSSCTGSDLTTAETVGSALCRAYGVDISSIIQAA